MGLMSDSMKYIFLFLLAFSVKVKAEEMKEPDTIKATSSCLLYKDEGNAWNVYEKHEESYFTTCLSVTPSIYCEMGNGMNQEKAYKQTIYWKKHKKLKRYALGVLGLGICGTIAGWIGEAGNSAYTNSGWKDDGKAWDAVLGIGLGLTVSSIPLFIISHKNKIKAKNAIEISLNGSMIHERAANGAVVIQPAVAFCVNF